VLFDLDNAPKAKRNAEPPKKKEKRADNPVDTPLTAAGKATASVVESKDNATAPKEKKEKKKDLVPADGKKAAASGKAAASAEDAGDPVPSMIDLRVGHILDGELVIVPPYSSR
jgi:aminoacyl tRNA synthase complex-interacting multifunctional protein 1